MHQSIGLMAILMATFVSIIHVIQFVVFFSKCFLVYSALFWLMEPLHVRDK